MSRPSTKSMPQCDCWALAMCGVLHLEFSLVFGAYR